MADPSSKALSEDPDSSLERDESSRSEEPPVHLFGDPASGKIDRRKPANAANPSDHAAGARVFELAALERDNRLPRNVPATEPGPAIRYGRGDRMAAMLNGLGVLLFIATIIGSALIFNNARDVGAFENPWNSNRVAIGFAVLALGLVHSALLVGVARAITYQLAALRLRFHETSSLRMESR